MKILIVDDNLDFCTTIADIIQSFGYDTHILQSPEEALNFLDKYYMKVSAVFLDIEFGTVSKLNGLDVLEQNRRKHPDIPVIMISGKGTIDMAVRATKLGAINFVEKSIVTKEKIHEVLKSALNNSEPEGETREIKQFLASQNIIGKSKVMLELGDKIIRFGRTDLNVLITGETGTGKRLVANAIHAVSRRSKYPIITVDIPNIPRELFQSELFGHIKGAFSGAVDNKKGLFHQANKGTLFLDEIGDLSMELQSSLFIPIEERSIRKVGSVENEDIDVRFISATDKDLLLAMKESRFREQLYHRLRECEIQVPPLSERLEDIPDIIEFYTKKHNEEFEENKYFSPSALSFMQEQNWTGNVRELASVVRVTLQTISNDEIAISDLNKLLSNNNKNAHSVEIVENSVNVDKTLKEDLAEVDKKKIENTLDKCAGNVSKAAAQLGISRETLHNKIRKYDINTQVFRVKKTVVKK